MAQQATYTQHVLRETPWTIVRGFFMGSADVVPGVSGGTIALVLGIYERLISSIRAGSSALGHLIRADVKGALAWLRRVEWGFLIALLGGILLAVVTLAGVLETLLHDHPVQTAGLFLGLIAGSVVIVWSQVGSWNAATLSTVAIVAVGAFVVFGLTTSTTETASDQLADTSTLAFFVAGAIAICAMILPGISGAFLLVLLGMYGPVLEAVNDRDIGLLFIFIAGAVVGLALFSQGLYWALQRHHDLVIAALIGLMIGSLRILWPWPDGLDSTLLDAPDEFVPVTVGAALVGFVIVIAIGWLARRLDDGQPMTAQPQSDASSGSESSDRS